MDFPKLSNLDEIFLAQKVLALGNKYVVTDTNSAVLLYSKQKLFKLKEDFRFYNDEEETQEALVIKAQNILDFSGKYEVVDPTNSQLIGLIKREGLASIIRGKWKILSSSGDEIAEVAEDSTLLAVLRRLVDFMTYLIPVKFVIQKDGRVFGEIQKKRALIRDRYYIDLRNDKEKAIDRRLAVALAVLLDSINNQ